MNAQVKRTFDIQKLVGTGVLAAIIVVLQTLATYTSVFTVGTASISLSLVPIVLGAVLYGVGSGTFLGVVFGLVVVVSVFSHQAGLLSEMMFQTHGFLTIFLCLFKGAAAGCVSGLICRVFQRVGHATVGIILAAILCPVCNTAIFSLALLTIYYGTAVEFLAAIGLSQSVATFTLTAVIGVNFLIELAINIVLAPVIVRVIGRIKKQH